MNAPDPHPPRNPPTITFRQCRQCRRVTVLRWEEPHRFALDAKPGQAIRTLANFEPGMCFSDCICPPPAPLVWSDDGQATTPLGSLLAANKNSFGTYSYGIVIPRRSYHSGTAPNEDAARACAIAIATICEAYLPWEEPAR